MKLLTRQEIVTRYNNGEDLDFVFFWGGYLSNWFESAFEIEGITYFCVEQYMMAMKAKTFNDSITLQKIMCSNDQKEVKQLGREVKNYIDEVWVKERIKVVYDGNLSKFTQNEGLKNYILHTNDKVLVEASPYDKIWGIKLGKDNPLVNNPNNWLGENYLGFTLMAVRESIKGGRASCLK